MNSIQLSEHIAKIIDYVGKEHNHGPKLNITENKEPVFLSEGMFYHIESNLPLHESIYRPQSAMFLKLFVEARGLYESKRLQLCEADKYYFDNTNIGKFGIYNDIMVPLDLPLTEEFLQEALQQEMSITSHEVPEFIDYVKNNPDSLKYLKFSSLEDLEDYILDAGAIDWNELRKELKQYKKSLNEAEDKKQPAIGKPKRGGAKKFYVYVKDKDKIKKVSFGMAGGGLRAKLNNPKARQAFSKRHNCPQKKDRTKASYWSCRLPRYAKLLGFKTTFSGFW